MQIKTLIKRHGWFLILLVAWLALAQAGRSPSPDSALHPTVEPEQKHAVVAVVPELPTSSPEPSATATPTPTATPSRTPTATVTPSPTPTHQPTATPEPSETPQIVEAASPHESSVTPTTVAAPTLPASSTDHPVLGPVVLANYYPWYDAATWSGGCASDRPLSGTYNSDDPTVIARHLSEARQAGLDGFAVHWYVRGNRTDTNLAQVLNASPNGFDSTVIFLCHIVGCYSQQDVIDQLVYITSTYGAHPHFFRIDGKPVIMFSGMERVPGAGGTHSAAIEIWGYIRSVVDPNHAAWWIAEGLEPGYLAVFDGLYVYKTDHACCPNSAAKAPTWASWVRDWEQRTGQAKLWVGTVMPGWDDVNSVSAACTGPDSRVGVIPFARDREDGAYYTRAWDAVLPTQPDFILLNSFNEWIEGSYIEPSAKYGDAYLWLTAAQVARFKSSR